MITEVATDSPSVTRIPPAPWLRCDYSQTRETPHTLTSNPRLPAERVCQSSLIIALRAIRRLPARIVDARHETQELRRYSYVSPSNDTSHPDLERIPEGTPASAPLTTGNSHPTRRGHGKPHARP